MMHTFLWLCQKWKWKEQSFPFIPQVDIPKEKNIEKLQQTRLDLTRINKLQ